jgi:hypothetical protein
LAARRERGRRVTNERGRALSSRIKPEKSMRQTVLLLALLFASGSGCVTNVPLPGPGDGRSVFVHPQTGEVRHCEDPGASAAFRGGILAANAYADCKTAAEEAGFARQR